MAGGGLVASAAGGPAQGKGKAGAGDQAGGGLGRPGGSAVRSRRPIAGWGRCGAGRAGRRRRAPVRRRGNAQVIIVNVVAAAGGGAAAGGSGACGGGLDAAVQGVADGGLAELGEGGQSGVPADPVPGPHLGLVPGADIFPRLERFLHDHLRPAMLMKYVMVAGLSSGAQHR